MVGHQLVWRNGTLARPADSERLTVPTVALFSTQFLEYSKTFIYEEIRHHIRYDVEVFSRRRLNHDRFPFDAVHVGGPLYQHLRLSRSFDRLFGARRYDVVHAHFGNGAVYALRYARKFDKPLVVTFHGFDVPLLKSWQRVYPKHWRYAVMGPRVLRGVTLALCASRELVDMVRELGVPQDRVRLHHVGIDLTTYGQGVRDPDHPRVIMVGRFVEKKGFEFGLRAFAQVAKGTSTRLTLVGDGAREPKLRSLVDALDLRAQVEFTGVLTQREIAQRLGASDILLAPSIVAAGGDRESGLVVAKEASASEVVPIGTRHGGIPEIIDDGVTGFLVPERDVNAMADRLARLLADAQLRVVMGKSAREKMQREYDNRVRVAALEDLYDEARERYRDRERGAGSGERASAGGLR